MITTFGLLEGVQGGLVVEKGVVVVSVCAGDVTQGRGDSLVHVHHLLGLVVGVRVKPKVLVNNHLIELKSD